MNLNRLIIVLFILLSSQFNCPGNIRYDQIRFKQLSISDGLPNNTVYSIEQDSEGYIWIGTRNGLCKYDGYDFHYYTIPNKVDSISDNLIKDLCYDEKNNLLWIFSSNGLSALNLDTEKFRRFAINDIEPRNVHFFKSESNDIYVGTTGGIYVFNFETDEFECIIPIDRKGGINIAEDKSGIVWINQGKSITLYDLKTKSYIPVPQVFREWAKKINNIYITKNNILFFHDGYNTYSYSIDSGKLAILQKDMITFGYRCISEDQEGNVWIGTEYGIYVYNQDNELIHHFESSDEDLSNLNDSPVYCIFNDRNNNIWIGTYFGGINYYIHDTDNFKVTGYGNSSKHLSGKAVRQIINDDQGGLYIATEDGGLNYMTKNHEIIRSDTMHKIMHLENTKNVHALYLDTDKNLWIGLYNKGVVKYSNGNTYRFHDRISAFWINESDDGSVWFGGPEGTFVTYDRNPESSSRVNNIKSFCCMRQNDSIFWIGTQESGIFVLNTHTQEMKHSPIFPEHAPFVSFLYKDSSDNIWIGTNNDGLYVVGPDGHIIRRYFKGEIGSNAIRGIVEDNLKRLWVSTDNGLVNIVPKDSIIVCYNEADGIPIKQFNYSSACRNDDGQLFFGTINGLISFYPEHIHKADSDFKIRITEIWSNDELISSSFWKNISRNDIPEIRLSHRQAQSLRIEYTGFNYQYSDKTLYMLKIDGINKDWQYLGNQHQIMLSNLMPGRYILRIKGSSDGKSWDDDGMLSFSIGVKPPWWASVPMIIIYFIACLVIVIGIYRFIKSRLLLQIKLKSEQEKRMNIEKMNQQKTNFFSYISHDLKTPLTLILSPLERLISKKDIGNEDKPKLEIIYHNASMMNYLIDELLTFSKIEMKQMPMIVKKGDIMGFLNLIYETFKMLAAEKKIDFTIELEQSSEEVWFSPSKVERIIYNLLSNAFKYNHQGGSVSLKTRLVRNNNDELFAEISVKDTGRGIPEDKLDRIFENYFQVDKNDYKEGFGIGLALCKSLVTMHKGTIKVNSRLGVGTEFLVLLNVSESAFDEKERSFESITVDDIDKYTQRISNSLRIEYAASKLAEKRSEKKNVSMLIVEDNVEMNNYIADIFSENFETIQAFNGTEAYDMARSKPVDIIISDVMMPGINGFNLCQKLKEDISTSHIPFVMLTAKTDEADKTLGYISGADAYISKPFNAKNIELLVMNILKTRQLNIDHFKKSEELNLVKITHTPKDEAFMTKLVDLIMQNINNEEFCVNDITSSMHISRSLLHNKVKALSGSSITLFIRTVKMKEAKKLFAEGLNISETSYAVGMSDPNYFTKCFKKEFGITPTEYIKSIKADEK